MQYVAGMWDGMWDGMGCVDGVAWHAIQSRCVVIWLADTVLHSQPQSQQYK